MFKKKEKPIKEKKIRTMKVGTHKKSVIALWVVLIASVSFGVYKNFTAIDQHTTLPSISRFHRHRLGIWCSSTVPMTQEAM